MKSSNRGFIVGLMLVFSLLSFGVSASGLYVVDQSKPVMGYLLGGSQDTVNQFTLNFSDNTAAPFISSSGPLGQVMDYGYHAKGTEAIAVGYSGNGGHWFYSYTPFNNDLAQHYFATQVFSEGESYMLLGFEDSFYGSPGYDKDFNDMVMYVSNLSPVPEPSNALMVAVGFPLLMAALKFGVV